MNAVTLSIFRHLFSSVADVMGVTLGRTASSPNIKERLDYSCAVFLADGRLLAQAAHIPVHLGAMPETVQAVIEACSPFHPGDSIIVNDPYLGGSHLPDITIISPVFSESNSIENEPDYFVASRAHHADIGGISPGSMPISTELFQEGIIIPPVKLIEAGQRNAALWQLILSNVRTPSEREGDLIAQLAANEVGLLRLGEIVSQYGLESCLDQAQSLIEYSSQMTRAAISMIPDGIYHFTDYLDNDGQSDLPAKIRVSIEIHLDKLTVDFSGTSMAVPGNLNAVPAITKSALAYCVRCIALHLLEAELPMNDGVFEPLSIILPPGSLLRPERPHAVAAGNVETSQRIVDVLFGALAKALPAVIPAASQGTMNNITFGSRIGLVEENLDGSEKNVAMDNELSTLAQFAYYETIGGGIGAGPNQVGGSGMHAHMSNTRNTPIEALEYSFPLRIIEYGLRWGSGGEGYNQGGDGLVRTIEFLSPVTVTLVSERRVFQPYGLNGGQPGKSGRNILIRQGQIEQVPGKTTVLLQPGDQLRLETPGGGGWGQPANEAS